MVKASVSPSKNLTPPPSRLSFHFIAFGILLLTGLIVYSNSFSAGFHLDDEQNILTNPTIQNLSLTPLLWTHFKARFLTFLSFALNHQMEGMSLSGFHFTNNLIHILAGFFAYFLTLQIFRTPALQGHPIARHREWISLLGGLLFICHPLQTQSVIYIVQRASSLGGLFYLSAAGFYLKARIDRKPLYYLAVMASTLCAFYSKESTYTLPFAILLLEGICFQGIPGRQKDFLRALLFFLPLVLVYATVYLHPFNPEQNSVGIGNLLTEASAQTSRTDYFFTQLNVVRTYIRLLIAPVGQNLDYDYPISRTLFEPLTLLSLALHLALLIYALKNRRTRPLPALGILWFYLTLSIESSFIPIGDVIFEHRLYLPLFGFVLVVLEILWRFWNHFRDVMTSGLLLVFLFSGMTYARNKVWESDVTLWRDVLKKSPKKTRAYVNLSNALGTDKEAMPLLEKALALDPQYFPAYNALGATAHLEGRYAEAVGYYDKALAVNPDYIDAIYHKALAYSAMGDYDKAVPLFEDALRRKPHDLRIYNDFGIAYGRKQDFKKAIDIIQRGLVINPHSAGLHETLSVIYIKQGEIESAKKEIEIIRALGLKERADYLLENISDGAEPVRETKITYFKDGVPVTE